MKPIQKLLKLFCLAALSCLSYSAFAVSETEPNDSWTPANIIQLSEYGVGGLSVGGDVDWWRVTSTTDGNLNVWCNAGYGARCRIYDTLGTVILAEFFTQSAVDVTAYGLKAGTYYIKLDDSSYPAFSVYNILPTWTTVPGNDPEPNGTIATAILKNIGDSITGTVSFYYNQQRDSADWYKVVLNSTQLFKPVLVTNGIDLRMQLYNSSGVTVLRESHSSSDFSLYPISLTTGTYYIRISSFDSVSYSSYTLKTLVVTMNETEPNDSWNQAKLITFSQNVNGKCTAGGDVDWWRVKSTTDGHLNVQCSPYSNISTYLQVYDTLGNFLLSSANGSNVFNSAVNGLTKGTYYIKVYAANAANLSYYSLVPTWTNTTGTNDPEPNNTVATAILKNINDSIKGRVNFYDNLLRDSVDYYKVIKASDGVLNLKIYPLEGVSLNVQLLDSNGTTVMKSSSTTTTFMLTYNGIGAGTYYFRVTTDSSNQASAYSIKITQTNAGGTNDAEPNNTAATAILKNINDSLTGHVNYYYNLKRDSADWYKVTITIDAVLILKIYPLSGNSLNVKLLAGNGTSVMKSSSSATSFVFTFDGVSAGTYYFKVTVDVTNEASAYAIKITKTNATGTNDLEPNNTAATAKLKYMNDSLNGHINYFSILQRDSVDWYKVTLTSDGQLNLKVYPLNGLALNVKLIDGNGTSVMQSASGAVAFTVSYNGLASGGLYYFKVSADSVNQAGSYAIKITQTNATGTNDLEPNNTAATAKLKYMNDSLNGHINYLSILQRDSVDWYKVTLTSDGQLNLKVYPLNGLALNVKLIDGNGTSVMQSASGAVAFTVSYNGLGSGGLYYFKVSADSVNQAGSYAIKITQTDAAFVNDVGANDDYLHAITLNPNDTATGHIGYATNWSNNIRDFSDWYKITCISDGNLLFNYSASINGVKVMFEMYDDNGTYIVTKDSAQFFPAIHLIEGLAAGKTVYIKVSAQNAWDFNSYSFSVKQVIWPVTNDAEPNDNYSQAITLSPISSTSGHINFKHNFYNNSSDSVDWYKVTIPSDGYFEVQNYVEYAGSGIYHLTLFESDGITVRDDDNLPDLVTDNLKQGTYYFRIAFQGTPGWYNLSTNFIAEPYTNDTSQTNDYAKNAAVITGNTFISGHLGFAGGGSTDSTDWWRIGFGGIDNLQFIYTPAQPLLSWQAFTVSVQLYGDTLAAPISSQVVIISPTYISPSYSHIQSGLTPGTYYLKLQCLYGQHGAYILSANYKDTTTSTIAFVSSSGTAGGCNTGKLNYLANGGVPPYTVQLYRNGVAYGAPVSTNDTAKFTSLTPDVYYATVKSSGAVIPNNTSTSKGLVTTVTGHASSNIQSTSAVVNWNAFTCVDGFRVSYKKTADPTFINNQVVSAGAITDTLKNLLSSTSYDYKVQAFVQYNNIKYYSAYTTVKTFITLAPRLGDDEVQQLEGEVSNLLIYPNPAQNELHVKFEGMDGVASLKLIDLTGRIVMEKQAEVTLNQYSGILDISNLQRGIYQLTITSSDGETITSKVIKQ